MVKKADVEKGQVFGFWTVLNEAEKMGSRPQRAFLVRCCCGTKKAVLLHKLRSGRSSSCGCKTGQLITEAKTVHGYYGHAMWQRYYSMLQRCYVETAKAYPDYGGRGIRVCKRWRKGEDGKSGFECYCEDMGNPPFKGAEVDRRDNDKGYSPKNCRWVTRLRNANNKRNNIRVTLDGKTRTLSQWSKKLKLKRTTILGRAKNGWSAEKILSK